MLLELLAKTVAAEVYMCYTQLLIVRKAMIGNKESGRWICRVKLKTKMK